MADGFHGRCGESCSSFLAALLNSVSAGFNAGVDLDNDVEVDALLREASTALRAYRSQPWYHVAVGGFILDSLSSAAVLRSRPLRLPLLVQLRLLPTRVCRRVTRWRPLRNPISILPVPLRSGARRNLALRASSWRHYAISSSIGRCLPMRSRAALVPPWLRALSLVASTSWTPQSASGSADRGEGSSRGAPRVVPTPLSLVARVTRVRGELGRLQRRSRVVKGRVAPTLWMWTSHSRLPLARVRAGADSSRLIAD